MMCSKCGKRAAIPREKLCVSCAQPPPPPTLTDAQATAVAEEIKKILRGKPPGPDRV